MGDREAEMSDTLYVCFFIWMIIVIVLVFGYEIVLSINGFGSSDAVRASF